MYDAGKKALRGYSYMAYVCRHEFEIPGFSMKPKIHAFHHILCDIQKQVKNRKSKFVLNPMCFNCETDEDFIGRIARHSRRISNRLASLRTLQMYRIKSKAVIRRFLKKQVRT